MLYDPKWNTDTTAEADVLLAAADYLEKWGWCQNAIRDSDGRACLLGALSLSISRIGKGNVVAAMNRLERHLKMSVDAWNDDICKSQEQAVDALRAAAQNEN